MSRDHEIYSIFGQIEQVAAETMIDKGFATKIEQDMIPSSGLFDERGRQAVFAIKIHRRAISTFERLIKDLYA